MPEYSSHTWDSSGHVININDVGGPLREAVDLSGVWAGVREGFREEGMVTLSSEHAQDHTRKSMQYAGQGKRSRVMFGCSRCPTQSREHTRARKALGTSPLFLRRTFSPDLQVETLNERLWVQMPQC